MTEPTTEERKMTDPAVMFCKPGVVSDADKAALREAGIIVVEVADPNDVRFVRAEGILGAQELPHGDLLAAAAQAIASDSNGYVKQRFATALAAALIARHAAKRDAQS